MTKSFLREVGLILLSGILFYPFAVAGVFTALILFGEGGSSTDSRITICVVGSLIVLSLVFVRLYWPNKVFKYWWSTVLCLILIWSQYFLFTNKIHV